MSEVTRKRSAVATDSYSSQPKRKQITKINKGTNPVNKDGLSQCFRKIKSSLYLSLAPIYTKSPLEGIKSQHLDSMIMKHFGPANGVVIGYDNLKLSEEHLNEDGQVIAKLNPHSPFAFFWINVDLLVWCPSPGDVVEGLIYIQSPSHIGLLINDTFNASIKKNFIPENWNFIPNQADEFINGGEDDDNSNNNNDNENSSGNNNNLENKKFQSMGQWVDENELPIDGKIKFTIRRIHNSGRVVSVEGSLVKPGSELEALPVTPGQNGKKIIFNDNDLDTVVPDEAKQDVPAYEDVNSSDDEEVLAEKSSSEDSDSDSD